MRFLATVAAVAIIGFALPALAQDPATPPVVAAPEVGAAAPAAVPPGAVSATTTTTTTTTESKTTTIAPSGPEIVEITDEADVKHAQAVIASVDAMVEEINKSSCIEMAKKDPASAMTCPCTMKAIQKMRDANNKAIEKHPEWAGKLVGFTNPETKQRSIAPIGPIQQQLLMCEKADGKEGKKDKEDKKAD